MPSDQDQPVGPPTPPGPPRRSSIMDQTAAGPTMSIMDPARIRPGLTLPRPDEPARTEARKRLAGLDPIGAGLADWDRLVLFAAGTQGRGDPRAWSSPCLLIVSSERTGGAAAGHRAGEDARLAARAALGEGPLGLLAGRAGARVRIVPAPAGRPMEAGPTLTGDEVDAAVEEGWRLANDTVSGGADVLVVGACGLGADAASAAVLAATAQLEPTPLLPRVTVPGGRFDDRAWMVRCEAVRDALFRIRLQQTGPTAGGRGRGSADHSFARMVNRRRGSISALRVLAEVGGGDIAVATGVLLGAAAARTPVLLDGPIGMAAALLGRELSGGLPQWLLVPDTGRHPVVTRVADTLGLSPLVNLRLNPGGEFGEGATALAALPILVTALALASDPAGRSTMDSTRSDGAR